MPVEKPVGSPRTADELFEPEREEPPPFLDRPQSAADPKALKDKAAKDKQKDLQEESDLAAVLHTQEGVRFVVRLLLACGIDQSVYWPNNSQMCEIAGRRSIANQLREWIKNVGLEEWFAVEREFENYRPKPKTSEKLKKPQRGP